MIDFNDEKITEQEKQDFLTQQIDPEYKKKRQKFGYIPFQAGWIITYKMLQILNNEAYKNEGLFDFCLGASIFEIFFNCFSLLLA